MACGALRVDTIGHVRRETGVTEMHFSALAAKPSGMIYRNLAIAMGGAGTTREYQLQGTDPELVARTIQAAREG
jgi:copper homeostasis protein